MPRVLNIKRDGVPEGAVYIGRLMPRYGLRGSKWHNPYKVGRDGTREEVIAKYERHLHDSGLIDAVHELRGLAATSTFARRRLLCPGMPLHPSASPQFSYSQVIYRFPDLPRGRSK
jgi:hypothetical protein